MDDNSTESIDVGRPVCISLPHTVMSFASAWIDTNSDSVLRGADDSDIDFSVKRNDFPALPEVPFADDTNHNSLENDETRQAMLNPLSLLESLNDSCEETNPAWNGLKGDWGRQGATGEQFGMAGMSSFLSVVRQHPMIAALAIGHDISLLGVDHINQSGDIYSTFGGPWSEHACRASDIDALVPAEYLTNTAIRTRLPSVKLNIMSEDVLFYLFFNFPGQAYQIAAACELYDRDWRYHTGLRVWLTRSQHGGFEEQTTTYEKGSYNVFDSVQWRKVRREMKLEYRKLEGRAHLSKALITTYGSQGAQSHPLDLHLNNSELHCKVP